jgi:hypothetical protein
MSASAEPLNMKFFYLFIALLVTVAAAQSSESSRLKLRGRVAEETVMLCSHPVAETASGEITVEVVEPLVLKGSLITHIARVGNERFADKNGALIGTGDIIEFTVDRKYIDPKKTGPRLFKKLKDVCIIEKYIPPPETDEQKAEREARKKISRDKKGPWAPPPDFAQPKTSQEVPKEGKTEAASKAVAGAEKK